MPGSTTPPAAGWRGCASPASIALYRYCDEHGIPYKNCGKLIVATTPEETTKLAAIRAHAEANGVAGHADAVGRRRRASSSRR